MSESNNILNDNNMGGSKGRLYNEKEIGAILRRTAELSRNSAAQPLQGLTLDELKELASEAGLDKSLVIQAASELGDREGSGPKRNWLGGPNTYSVTRNFDGHVSDQTWEDVLTRIRQQFNDPGLVTERGAVREWTDSGRKKTLHVSLQQKGPGTQLRVFWSDPRMSIPTYLPFIYAVVLSPVILFEELSMGWTGVPVYIAILGTVFMLCRLLLEGLQWRKEKQLSALSNDLSRLIRESASSQSASQTSAGRDQIRESVSPPALEIPDVEEGFEADQDSSRSAHRIRD